MANNYFVFRLLVFVFLPDDRLDAEKYPRTFLSDFLLPVMDRQEDFFYAGRCIPAFDDGTFSDRERLKLKSLEWPAKSPDLNPIENIWSILKRKIRVQELEDEKKRSRKMRPTT